MDKKYWLSVGVLILLMVVSACGKGGNTTGAPTSQFIGGFEGVSMAFEKDSPPPEVTDDGTFEFRAILKLRNEGEEDIDKNDLNARLIGFLPDDFGATPQELGIISGFRASGEGSIKIEEPVLYKKSRSPEGDIIEGGTTFVNIPKNNPFKIPAALNRDSAAFSGNTPFTFRAELCYKYHSTANARICVLRNLLDSSNDKVCEPRGSKPIDSSGSPVQITNFRQAVLGRDSLTFTFDIVHRGVGEVYMYEEGKRAVCPRDDVSLKRMNRDKVYVKVSLSNAIGSTPECSFDDRQSDSGYVRLVDGLKRVTCKLNEIDTYRSDFESIVKIDADFNYDQNIQTKVLVKHVPISR